MTDEDDNLDRAERLGQRRSSRKRREGQGSNEDASATAGDDTGESMSQQSQPSETAQTSQTKQTSQSPLTERTHSTFYLRDDLQAELRQVRKQLELDVDLEYGIELEKNRHIRPLMLYLGAKKLEDMDATDVAEMLDTTDVLDGINVTDSTDDTDGTDSDKTATR